MARAPLAAPSARPGRDEGAGGLEYHQAPAVGHRPFRTAAQATQSGHPLNPWTIPNTIDYLRLLGIPVFLVVALSSDDGQDALAVVLFGVIGWSATSTASWRA